MTTTAIQIQKVRHAFEGRTVLSEVTVAVPSGCFFTIIGPNGSGKTTLLKLMMGLIVCRQGTIEILGRPLSRYGVKHLARTVAYVPQAVPVTFAFTVVQVVLMGRAPHLGLLGLEGQQDLELARQAMALAGVDHLADRRLDQLSGGEQQRVFIARAICQQPKILLLDEPTAALDLAHQVRVMDLMEQLKTEHGVTVVMVSHDLNPAAMYADLMLLLSKGCTVGLGSAQQVLAYQQLEQVYGCPLLVDKSPLGDYPRVHLVPRRYLDR